MRGTLHLLPAAELPLWQAARSTTRLWEAGSWLRGFGVTRQELALLSSASARRSPWSTSTAPAPTCSRRRGRAGRRGASPLGAAAARLGPVRRHRHPAGRHLPPGPFKQRIYRPQGWLSPVLLVGGRMDGGWRQEAKGRRPRVTIEPFTTLPGWARRAAEDEAERLAAWSGAEPELAFNEAA